MNIEQAKEQIRKTCVAYLTKDERGSYVMPAETQRPVFLVGAPGIGKTAIVSQVADELGLALVDYSMTHHTRQSAIGLPLIAHREYGGRAFEVSEYTMSEIIASVYDAMERTGKREGILFLDEVNCVSETLEPAMLRFLQNKTFGNHRVPSGWVVVSAGNPLEFNRSARQFDVVTLDRMKRIDVEPDFGAWREYALNAGVHPAVLSYLEGKPASFYRMETQGRTRHFVTARAWMDLSNMLRLYEMRGLEVDEFLAGQYLQIASVARDFFTYFELFAAYSQDYRVPDILAGVADEELAARARAAGFDERAALGGLLADAVIAKADGAMSGTSALEEAREALSAAKSASEGAACPEDVFREALEAEASRRKAALAAAAPAFHRGLQVRAAEARTATLVRDAAAAAAHADDPFHAAAERFNRELSAQEGAVAEAQAAIDNAIDFAARAFGEGNELVVMLSELTLSKSFLRFAERYGCRAYFDRSERLMLERRATDLELRLEKLESALD